MEYKKFINLLDNTPNEPSNFRTRNWVKINDDARGRYATNSQIKFKTAMLKSSLCDYRDVDMLVNGTILVANTEVVDAAGNNNNKEVIFKNCASFTDYISERNNTQVDIVKDINVVMPIYKLIKFGDNYSKISRNSWQYYRSDEPFTNDAGVFTAFTADDNMMMMVTRLNLNKK